ncbi:MAG: transcriptional repressor [Actinomycetota bacterium]
MRRSVVEAHELVAGRLQAAGQLYTAGRRSLVDQMLRAGRPTTIAELLSWDQQRTQSSLYRNLADLESVNVVRRVVGLDERTRFECSEDILGHHHHTMCGECGIVGDFVLPSDVERLIEDAVATALATAGFAPRGGRLDVTGACAECHD